MLQPACLQAGSTIEFSIDGGYSTILYKVLDGKHVGGLGYGANIGYAYFFHQNVGLGIGLGFRHYAGGAQINGILHYPNVIDTDKEPYEHLTYYSKWCERQNIYYFEIPLSLQFYIPLNHIHLWMAVGANYSLALLGKTSAHGNITHRGYYEKWDLTLDIPAHGFYETSDFKPHNKINLQPTVALFARMDIGIPLTYHWDLLVGVNVHYALLNVFNMEDKLPLGFRNDKEGWQNVHYFMNDYSSLLKTPIVSGKALPLSVNLEIGVKYRFNTKHHLLHHRKYPCRCVI